MFNLFKSRKEKIDSINIKQLKKLLKRLKKVAWDEYSSSTLNKVPYPRQGPNDTSDKTYFTKYLSLKNAIEAMIKYPRLVEDFIFTDTENFIKALTTPHSYFHNQLIFAKSQAAIKAVEDWKNES